MSHKFQHNPTLEMVLGDNLRSKTAFVRRMQMGMNTDFQKVFDLILEVAVNGKLTEEQMIKRLFVFSDMEFDQASSRPWETDYQEIVRKFGERGYGSCVPEVVFWNLRDSLATPVPGNQKGVALVSGFSKNLMTLFLEESVSLNPEPVMEVAISGEESGPMNPEPVMEAAISGQERGFFNPEAVMEVAISGEEYKKLVVLD